MHRRTILLVEDNPADEELTLIALENCQVPNQVIVARDGVEALNHLLDQDETLPDLVLMDLKLPKISGLDVLRRLRSDPRTQFLPVVILTTSIEEQDLINGYRSGCNSYICKPIDFNQFSAAVCQLGRYWLRLNEFPQSQGV